MPLLDATYKAGDTVKFDVVAQDYDGSLITGLTGTIDIFYSGAKVVDAQAITSDSVRQGWYYYNYVTASAGIYSFNMTLSNGHVGSGIIEVSSGDAAKETTSQAILADTDTYLDATISSRLANADYTAPDNAGIANILADTNELQTNQGDWLTADVSALALESTAQSILTDTDAYLDATISSRSTLTAAQVWDEILTAATHNIATSAGRRLRDLTSSVILTGTAQGAGINGNQIILDSDASATDGAYDPVLVHIAEGTGAGQCRLGLQYDGSTKTLTVDRTWRINPDTSSKYVLVSHPGREHVNEGLARGGTESSITLNANASSLDGNYEGQLIFLRSGTGEDQVAIGAPGYNGTTKVLPILGTWGINPDTTTGYIIVPNRVPDISPFALEATSQTILADTDELQQNQNNWITADLTDIALEATLQATKTVIDTNLDATVSSRSTFDSTIDEVTGNFTLDQTDFNEKMDVYFTPGTGNTPGIVPPPPSIDLVRVYVNIFDNEDTALSTIKPNIDIIGAYRYSDKIFAFDKDKWTYTGGVLQFLVPAYCQISITISLPQNTIYKKRGYVGAGGTTIDAYDLYDEDQTP